MIYVEIVRIRAFFLEEELAIPAKMYQVIGELDDFLTHDQQLVRPFIATLPKVTFMHAVHLQSNTRQPAITLVDPFLLHCLVLEPLRGQSCCRKELQQRRYPKDKR